MWGRNRKSDADPPDGRKPLTQAVRQARVDQAERTGVVVDDFDVFGIPISPIETHPPLVINADGILPLAISLQLLKPVGRRRSQIGHRARPMYHHQLAASHGHNIRGEPARNLVVEQKRRPFIFKTSDRHGDLLVVIVVS